MRSPSFGYELIIKAKPFCRDLHGPELPQEQRYVFNVAKRDQPLLLPED